MEAKEVIDHLTWHGASDLDSSMRIQFGAAWTAGSWLRQRNDR
jgi:hypothetical protein